MDADNSDARKNLRKNLADILFNIGDLERTKLEWAGKVPGVMRLYIEDVEGFFTDVLAGMSLDENVDAGILDEEEAAALQPFHDAFDKYFESTKHLNRSDVEITEDPKWKRISELAAATYEKIDSRLRS